MAISTENFTSFMEYSLLAKLKSVVGLTYSFGNLTSKNITYVAGYPSDFKKYKDNLPMIVIQDLGSGINRQAEQGGKRSTIQSYYVHVFAGGYEKESHNEFMKNGITDKIRFGFDEKTFNFVDNEGLVYGTIESTSTKLDTSRRDKISVFENHHGIINLDLEVWIYNN